MGLESWQDIYFEIFLFNFSCCKNSNLPCLDSDRWTWGCICRWSRSETLAGSIWSSRCLLPPLSWLLRFDLVVLKRKNFSQVFLLKIMNFQILLNRLEAIGKWWNSVCHNMFRLENFSSDRPTILMDTWIYRCAQTIQRSRQDAD